MRENIYIYIYIYMYVFRCVCRVIQICIQGLSLYQGVFGSLRDPMPETLTFRVPTLYRVLEPLGPCIEGTWRVREPIDLRVGVAQE